MKQLIASSLFATSIFLAGCGTSPTPESTPSLTATTHAQQPASWLFLVHAPNANITQKTDGTFVLAMKPITHVQGFTDRPNRKTHVTSIQTFVAQIWNEPSKDNFKQDHPNAAIAAVIDRNDHMLSDELVILAKPQYDAKTQTLSFTINKMTKQEILHAEKLQDVTLFIDATVDFGEDTD